jgi:hypothetical protein
MKKVYLTLFLVFLKAISADTALTNSTIVEISPSALEALVHPFDQLIVYFHDHTLPAEL